MTALSYEAFLESKAALAPSAGFEIGAEEVNPTLFPFQRDLVRWAVRKGRSAIFADTGLGKTFMQLEWARLIGKRTLILAPLSVARQTVAEASKLEVELVYARSQLAAADLTITNYEMVDRFDVSSFEAVVLDESSILKATEGATRNRLVTLFAETPFRLACTATPAPNDIQEITNHSAYLGVMRRRDVLATFFIHAADDARASGWRLKGHAREAFWRWLASWGMSLKRPSDLGYSDEGYVLPPLDVQPMVIDAAYEIPGKLFADKLRGVTERAAVRRQTLRARVEASARLIDEDDGEPWIAWVGLNDEAKALCAELGVEAVEVKGSDPPERKAEVLEAFIDGEFQTLVTKTSIAGFGMNFQHCARQVFVGLNDSYEQYYQAIRRSWRFGQPRPVRVHVVISEPERAVYDNVLRKEREAEEMATELVRHVAAYERAEVGTTTVATVPYEAGQEEGTRWRMLLGDSAERLSELPADEVDLAVFSPPFQALYVYSATDRDLGNCGTPQGFFTHLGYITRELRRVMRPGRNVAVHCAQITAQKILDGVIGLKDFRGSLIEHFQQEGFVYHGEVCIDKDPQAQAIRTHAKGLLFVQLRKDASWLRPALADYLLVFRAPGENEIPVRPDITDQQWIEWARPVWYGIRETDTLQAPPKRNDERHVAPLQLGVVERAIRLWSNRGETVLDPFAGIATTGYEAVRLGRRFVGIDLKREYFDASVTNLREAEGLAETPDLFTAQAVTRGPT